MDMSRDPGFLSIANYDLCLKIFGLYMKQEYNLTIDDTTHPSLREMLLTTMQEVKKTQLDRPVKHMNNVTLNELRDIFLQSYNVQTSAKKPEVKNLVRDQQLFGNRPIVSTPDAIYPKIGNNDKDDVNKTYERMVNERNAAVESSTPTTPQLQSTKPESAISATDFNKAFESMALVRSNDRLNTTIEIHRDPVDNDPKALFQGMADAAASVKDSMMMKHDTPFDDFNQKLLIAKDEGTRHTETMYMLINGYDRNWTGFPYRYRFTINLDETGHSPKNVSKIKFTRLILPMEIRNPKRNNAFIQSNDATYYNQYGLTYPYVLLQIDQFSNYGGVNKNTQKSFAQFVYDKEYRAPNGRGFLIMKPLQGEEKHFSPSPLASLSRLGITISKPNGTLYNNSKDENNVIAMQAETINPLLIKVQTEHYYDKNEYFTGDVILIKSAAFMSGEDFRAQFSPTPPDLQVYNAYKQMVEDFINRPEGHEVIEIGEPNTNTYHRGFYFYMPRALDKASGVLVVQSNFLDFINVAQKYSTLIQLSSPGHIINMSLQAIVSFKVDVLAHKMHEHLVTL